MSSRSRKRFSESTRKRTRQRRAVFETLEPRRLLAGEISLVRYFDTWGGGIIRSTDVAGMTYHPPSGHLILTDSEIDELPDIFNGDNIFEVSLRGDQVFRTIASHNAEPAGITYNAFDGFFYVTNDDNRHLARYDDALNAPLAWVDTRNAVANANDPEDVAADPATGDLYVADGNGGGRQVLVYNSNLEFQRSFSVASRMLDTEGIAFHPTLRHLLIVSSLDHKVFEYMLDGTFVDQYDISGFFPKPRAEQGLTFAPTSDPNDDPGALALYIADGGKDNYPDGRVYETLISGGQPGHNTLPAVNAGDDQTVTVLDLSTPAVALLDATVTDDGLPIPPGAVSTQWVMLSGPATVTFGNEHAVDTTVSLPAAGTYVLRLTADDGQLTTSDEVTIIVQEGGLQNQAANEPTDSVVVDALWRSVGVQGASRPGAAVLPPPVGAPSLSDVQLELLADKTDTDAPKSPDRGVVRLVDRLFAELGRSEEGRMLLLSTFDRQRESDARSEFSEFIGKSLSDRRFVEACL